MNGLFDILHGVGDGYSEAHPRKDRQIHEVVTDEGRLLVFHTQAFLDPGVGLPFVAYAQGHLFYHRDGTLMAQPFDEKAGRLTGDAAPMIENIDINAGNGRAAFSVAANGTLAYRASGSSGTQTLTWFDRQGKRVGTVGEPGTYFGNPQVSRDGRWLAVGRGDAGKYDIWTIDLKRNVPTRLTSDPADDTAPVWSADGTHVIFRSNRKAGIFDVYQRAAGGGGADELLFESPENKWPDASDGKSLLFSRAMGRQHGWDLLALPLTGDRKPFPVIATEFSEVNSAFSPDGRWIAYQSNESGSAQAYLQPFPTTGARVRVSTTTGTLPQWSADGKQIFYRTSDNHIMVVDMTSPLRPGVPKELFTQTGAWTIDPSGQRFLFATSAEAGVAAPITVVLNFVAGMGKK